MKAWLAWLVLLAGPALANDGLGGMLPPARVPGNEIADPIAVAIKGLNPIEIEDDVGKADAPVKAIVTKGCKTAFKTGKGTIIVNWSRIEQLGPADTFVFVKAPGVQFALIGDASRPDQAKKLANVHAAMLAMAQRCTKPG
ncbi:MAG: hypothetical protein ACRCY3_08535 [Sphingorhabdus sp.]